MGRKALEFLLKKTNDLSHLIFCKENFFTDFFQKKRVGVALGEGDVLGMQRLEFSDQSVTPILLDTIA